METGTWIVLAAIAAVIIAGIALLVTRQRRQTRLHDAFGPEDDGIVGEAGNVRHGESEPRARRRRGPIEVRPLTAAARSRYERAWDGTQGRFVDDPAAALAEADELIRTVMRERGYPVEDFEQRAADLSVDHPDVVQHYRAAFRIASQAGERETSTEQMRQGLVHYRVLFAELIAADHGGRRQVG